MNKGVVLKGLVLIFFAIILGAFASHYLENILRPKQLNAFRTGVDYQLYGGLLLTVFGLNQDKFKFSTRLPVNLFFIGVCLFSISIYLMSLFYKSSIVYYIWPITPIGGLLMIISVGIMIIRLVNTKLK